ncbi:hypothetical protein [Parvularcula maris]|uniref:Uncharacterized protein n=1 Tax=Parvularcula maris TaxID=2965077 RepID=A0A9X2LC29_9PROT|nr:hypothetical protein [Parvularcula maris]MCQ8185797.1 hypothetical protein [Parvularcula maris]
MLRAIDKIWVQMGLRRDELRRERGRGALYMLLGLCLVTSTLLATDLALNVTGRFG